MTNREKLKRIMKLNNMDREEVCKILGVKMRTLVSWLSHPDRQSHRNMADRYIELLGYKLENKQ